jgi:hypothetical protein
VARVGGGGLPVPESNEAIADRTSPPPTAAKTTSDHAASATFTDWDTEEALDFVSVDPDA